MRCGEARRVARSFAPCRWGSTRPAATLLELLVVLAVMALVASLATLSVRGPERGPRSDPWTLLADARRRALRDGRYATIVARIDGRPAVATAFPDGRVAADSAFGVNGLTGQPLAPQAGVPR